MMFIISSSIEGYHVISFIISSISHTISCIIIIIVIISIIIINTNIRIVNIIIIIIISSSSSNIIIITYVYCIFVYPPPPALVQILQVHANRFTWKTAALKMPKAGTTRQTQNETGKSYVKN